MTTVGGTQLDPTGSFDNEKAASFDFYPLTDGAGSTGGFSNYFPTPSYQSSQVLSYIKGLGSAYTGRYNASGRGFPDVSALAVNYTTIWRGGSVSVSGTSASAPVFASIIALLNDKLIAAGKSPLGFLNPLLYSDNGTVALTDITTGQFAGNA